MALQEATRLEVRQERQGLEGLPADRLRRDGLRGGHRLLGRPAHR